MKKARFTESQIVAAIKKQESGASVRDVCRELGISDATFYKLESQVWRHGSKRCQTHERNGSGTFAV